MNCPRLLFCGLFALLAVLVPGPIQAGSTRPGQGIRSLMREMAALEKEIAQKRVDCVKLRIQLGEALRFEAELGEGDGLFVPDSVFLQGELSFCEIGLSDLQEKLSEIKEKIEDLRPH